MQNDGTKFPKEVMALPESKKLERRAAMEEIKRLHPGDPAGAREAARLWFEQNAQPLAEGGAEASPFHRRMLSEADPERADKAAQALKQNEAEGEQAQSASRQAVKEWRKRNPNKVKKLGKLYREQVKTRKNAK
jgi:cell envelope opacity-associated protein A